MNAITTPKNSALGALAGLKASLQNVVATMPVATGGFPILRMLKDGDWVYGQGNVEVEDGAEWGLNPLSLKHGFVCWDSNKNELLGEVMVGAAQPKPDRASLPQKPFEWKEQLTCDLYCLTEGRSHGVQVVYKTSSMGGLNAMHGLIDELLTHLAQDEVNVVPVVVLESEHYAHKKYGKTYTPTIRVIDWEPMSDAAPTRDEETTETAKVEAPKEDPKTIEAEPVQTAATPASTDDGTVRRRRRG